MVTVLPPMRSSMAPKLGRLSPMIRRDAIKHVLNKHLLQVKTEKFSKRWKSAASLNFLCIMKSLYQVYLTFWNIHKFFKILIWWIYNNWNR